jgi:Ricin-type beta-trefoil lectin domain/Glycosyl hydrolases family 43
MAVPVVIEEARVSRTTPYHRPVAVITAVLAALAGLLALGPSARAATVTIVNRTQFPDTSGNPVQAHGGGIIKVGAYYYWFGENRNPDSSFKSVTVYRSSDLKNWEFRNNALTQSSASELASANIERPKVMYNAATGQFVMWMHKETATDYGQARAAVAVSSTVDGTYSYRGSFRPFNQYMSRDINVFVDDDGAGYMVSSSNENRDLNVYRLTADYTNVQTLVRSWPGDTREAPALFKRNGVYFMITSAATGWSPNQAKYSTSTSITGSWSGWANLGDSTTYGSQSTAVLAIQGTQTTSYLYLGDRWGPGFGSSYAASQYVWLPLRFPSSTSLALDYYDQITVDTETGAAAGVQGSYVRLSARNSGKCADINGASTADNAELIQYTCGGGANQQFTVRDAGGGYVQLVARHSGKCLDVSGVSTADGAAVIQYTCGGGTNQQWQFQDAGSGYYRVVARHSGKCLDVAGSSTADSARIRQSSCNGGANQQWQRQNV